MSMYDAVITGIPEQPEKAKAGNRFRPRWAADIKRLSDGLEHRSVQLPLLPIWQWPKPGTRCLIAYAENEMTKPRIIAMYPEGGEMPALAIGETVIPFTGGEIRIGAGGAVSIETANSFKIDAKTLKTLAESVVQKANRLQTKIEAGEKREIGGNYELTAMGGIREKIGADHITAIAGRRSLSAMGQLEFVCTKLNVTAAKDIKLSNVPQGMIKIDENGFITVKNIIGGDIKTHIDALIDIISKIIVTLGTGPNTAQLVELKTKLGLLLINK